MTTQKEILVYENNEVKPQWACQKSIKSLYNLGRDFLTARHHEGYVRATPLGKANTTSKIVYKCSDIEDYLLAKSMNKKPTLKVK